MQGVVGGVTVKNWYTVLIALTLATTTTALGHHSMSIYDTDSLYSVEGTVTEFEWKNPHPYIRIEMTGASALIMT